MNLYRVNTGQLRIMTARGFPILLTEQLYRQYIIGKIGYVFSMRPPQMFPLIPIPNPCWDEPSTSSGEVTK